MENTACLAHKMRMFCGEGDLKMFLFYFEKVILKSEENRELSLKLLVQMDHSEFELSIQQFNVDEKIKMEGEY